MVKIGDEFFAFIVDCKVKCGVLGLRVRGGGGGRAWLQCNQQRNSSKVSVTAAQQAFVERRHLGSLRLFDAVKIVDQFFTFIVDCKVIVSL